MIRRLGAFTGILLTLFILGLAGCGDHEFLPLGGANGVSGAGVSGGGGVTPITPPLQQGCTTANGHFGGGNPPFANGQFCTVAQTDLNHDNPFNIASNSDAVLGTVFRVPFSGPAGGGCFEIAFSSQGNVDGLTCDAEATVIDAIQEYLPAQANANTHPLTANNCNPTGNASNTRLGGELVTLAVNIAFSGAGLEGSGDCLGGLILCNFTGGQAFLNGTSITQFLANAEAALSCNGTAGFADATALANFVESINDAFSGCSADAFANAHLCTH